MKNSEQIKLFNIGAEIAAKSENLHMYAQTSEACYGAYYGKRKPVNRNGAAACYFKNADNNGSEGFI